MSDQSVDALQVALAAEHAAIWGYGVVGARIGDDLRERAAAAQEAHRELRDTTIGLVRDQGADPEPARASYDLPFDVDDSDQAVRLAQTLEEGVARSWHYALGLVEHDEWRRHAATALSDVAVRAAGWREAGHRSPTTVPFPGRE